jgi:predicted small secreted protein
MNKAAVKSMAVIVAGAFVLQGCATTQGSGKDRSSTGEKVGASAAIGVGAGLLCAILGGDKDKCLATAVIVGGISYAVQVAVEQKKIKSAQQVNTEAQNSGLKISDEVKPLPGSYNVALEPAVVKAGDKAVLVSNVSMYGKGDAIIEHVIQLLDQDGKPVGKERRETFKTVEGKAAGSYVSNATYQIPNGWSGQKFGFMTTLMVNGKAVDTQNNVKMTILANKPSDHHLIVAGN